MRGMRIILTLTFAAFLFTLGACSSLPPGEPEADMPIYGSSTPR